jgi:ABC-type multidrug transport system fused ATPase/permease subunit
MNEWENASHWSKWTFSVANRILSKEASRGFKHDDLVQISKDDSSSELVKKLRKTYENSKTFYFIPKLFIALFNINRKAWIFISLLMLLDGIIRILLPVSLIFLLGALNEPTLKNDQYYWACVISILSISQAFVHHTAFYCAIKIGWNWKNACIALIHEKLFELNLNTLQVSGNNSGKLMNMISNDVARLEDFATVFIYLILFKIYNSRFYYNLIF